MDLAQDTVTDVVLGVEGKSQEGVGLIGKLAKGEVLGATDSVTQTTTLLSGKLDDAYGIVCN